MSSRRVAAVATGAALVTLTACAASSSASGTARGSEPARLTVRHQLLPLGLPRRAHRRRPRGGDEPRLGGSRAARPRAHAEGRRPQVDEADLVVYLSGFQPAVDDAVGPRPRTPPSTRPRPPTSACGTRPRGGRTCRGQSGAVDPHFWLDPARLRRRGQRSEQRGSPPRRRLTRPCSAERRPPRRRPRRRSTRTGRRRPGPATPASSSRATTPSATSAQRYGFTQLGITGLTPDAEPSPQGPGRRHRLRAGPRGARRSTTRPWSARPSRTPSPARPAPGPRSSTRSRA